MGSSTLHTVEWDVLFNHTLNGKDNTISSGRCMKYQYAAPVEWHIGVTQRNDTGLNIQWPLVHPILIYDNNNNNKRRKKRKKKSRKYPNIKFRDEVNVSCLITCTQVHLCIWKFKLWTLSDMNKPVRMPGWTVNVWRMSDRDGAQLWCTIRGNNKELSQTWEITNIAVAFWMKCWTVFGSVCYWHG